MDKSKKLIAVAVSLVVAALLAVSIFITSDGIKTQDRGFEKIESSSDKAEIKFLEEGQKVQHSGREGYSALDALKLLTDVETKKTDFGPFVISINNVSANQDEEFWAFYVNGEMANEGASTYMTVDGDEIEWRLEKIN